MKRGLYLKVKSKTDERFIEANKFMNIFDMGYTPIFVLFEDTNKVFAAPKERWIYFNEVLFNQLIVILGEDNVKHID